MLVAGLVLSACAPAPRVSGINDPHETSNRATHEFNKRLDKTLLKPLSAASSGMADSPLSRGLDNFTSNLAMPGIILNHLLQGDVGAAAGSTARLAMNSTFGLAGLVDVAGQNGIREISTDFGETLHVWGMHEGDFVELPFYGASTERDALGLGIDYVIDPLNFLVPAPYIYVLTALRLMNKVGDRARYAGLIESILYESADSYAQSRLLYLQSRRKTLYGELSDEELEDPYAE